MSRLFKKLIVVALGVGLTATGFGQGTYRPGQTFSAGATPAPAARPQQSHLPVYRPQQPAATPQASRSQAQPQRRATSPASASMYNMQNTKKSSADSREKETGRKPAASAKHESRALEKKVTSGDESKSESAKKTEVAAKSSENTSSSHDDKAADSTSKSAAPSHPVTPDSTDKLVFFSRKTGKKQIALTYDDGPNPTLTPELIEWLKANNVPATFFMMGSMVKEHSSLAKQVADAGFELANHTYSHPDLRKLSTEKITDELQDTHDAIKEATGVDVKMMRPPYGAHNSKVDEVCKKLGYKIINWDVDTNDWRNRPTELMVKTIMSETHDGSIILMHDRKHKGRPTVLETTKQVVPMLREKGYTFVTVGELIGLDDTSAPAKSASIAPQAASTSPSAPMTALPAPEPATETSGSAMLNVLP